MVSSGATIAYLNFHWLKKVVTGLADLTIGSGTPASSRGVVHRFLLRYFLMAIVAFVILAVSRESLFGLFAGLFLPVAAILCETAAAQEPQRGPKQRENQEYSRYLLEHVQSFL